MSIFFGISSDSVSTLFSNLGNVGTANASGKTSGGSILAEYAALRDGSFYKLTKAYYSKLEKDNGVSKSMDTAKELNNMKSAADELVAKADVLLEKGSKSLFKTEPENKDALYHAVKEFAEAYNSTIEAGKDANHTAILTAASSMTKSVQANKSLLGSVGVSVDKENKITVDEEAFKQAKWTTIQSLFHGNGSFAYAMKGNASYLSISAKNE